MSAIPSPCTKVCAIDPSTGLCLGCGRTLKEIATWASMAPDERRAVLRRIEGAARQVSPPAGPRL